MLFTMASPSPSRPACRRLPVAVEDARQGVGGDADARVLDRDLDVVAEVVRVHADAAAGWRVLDGVADEVHEHLQEPLLVALHAAGRPRAVPREDEAARFRLRAELVDGARPPTLSRSTHRRS
jgi:hypothetical protein